MTTRDERLLAGLVVFNLGLQAFDGLATYAGLRAGIAEGNPLLVSAMGALGIAPALLGAKLWASASVLLLWHLRRSALALPALFLCAATYVACSLGPWTVALAGVHLDLDWYIAS